MTVDADDNIVDFLPVPEDSQQWAQSRVSAGLKELKRCGLAAIAWETPHYAASALDYQVFAANFPLTIHRVLYFDNTGNVAGHLGRGNNKNVFDTSGRLAGQFFPYVIHRDAYGQKIAPENLRNIDPLPWHNYPARLPADLVRAARKNLVVRDGWASAFYHPYLGVPSLQSLVGGVKALGYKYVPLSAAVE